MPTTVSIERPLSVRWASVLGAFAALFLLLLVLYASCLHGALLWDDPAHVTRLGLQGWAGLARIWFEFGATQEYYPVLHSAFWLEHGLWGDATIGYHLVNLILHAANACLLAMVLRRAAGTRLPRHVEWVAAVLFAVHPVCVESVAWITEQKNTLSTFFYLLSAWLYLDFAETRRPLQYGAAFLGFALALGAKTATVTLPPALLVILWWRQGTLGWRRDLRPLVPWLALAFAAGLLTAWFERHWVGAAGGAYELSLASRALLAGRVLWFYLGTLVWPAHLAFFYPRWDVSAEAAGWWLHAAAALAVTGGVWAIRKRSRAPLALWLLFAGSLFPVMGFFNVFAFSFSYVADHFQYLAVPVFAIALAVGVTGAVRTWVPRMAGMELVPVLVVGCGLALLTHRQSRLYVADETLFRANIAANPDSWMAHHILATKAARDPARRDEAITLYRRALELRADNPDSMAALAALLVEQPGHHAEALALFAEALRLRPAFAEAHNGLANELLDEPGRLEEAIAHYRTALALRPKFALARANLAQAFARVPGREDEALACFAEVLDAMPEHAPSHFHLANLLARLPGRAAEAVPHYQAVLSQFPGSVPTHYQLARVLAGLGRTQEAIEEYRVTVRLDPSFVAAQQELQALARGAPR